MPELRWTLLVLGALFIAALAWWELRRQRQARGNGLNQGSSQGTNAGSGSGANTGAGSAPSFTPGWDAERTSGASDHAGEGRVHREPTITFPELQPDARTAPVRGREPNVDPPIVELDGKSFAGLRVFGETGTTESTEIAAQAAEWAADDAIEEARFNDGLESAVPNLSADPDDDEWQQPRAAGDAVVAGEEPLEGAAGIEAGSSDGTLSDGDSSVGERNTQDGRPGASQLADRGADSHLTPGRGTQSSADADTSGARGNAGSGTDTTGVKLSSSASSARGVDASAVGVTSGGRQAMGATAAGDPVVDWPAEETRKIIALRLVSAPAARFAGRSVRLALAAEGFVLGKFDIFHKPGPDSRTMLSAANLTKPGTFAMNTIDAQRFGGLSLFAVLPGPLPAQTTFDELLTTARNLNERLEGALQDERGEPLTPTRSTTIRDSLGGGAPPDDHDASDDAPESSSGSGASAGDSHRSESPR